MKTNISLLSLLLMLIACQAGAQQIAPFASFYSQPVLTNPAYTGHAQTPQAFLLFRKQWVGIPDSPETQMVDIDGNLAENMGVGLMLTNDRQNIIGRTGVYATYKYDLKLAEQSTLSFALQGGGFQHRIFFEHINANDEDDAALLLNTESQIVPDLNFGMLLKWKELELGVSGYQLLSNKIVHENQANFQESAFRMIRHFNASMRYSFHTKGAWSIDPYVTLRSVQGMSVFGDVALFFNHNDQYWFGGGYRYNNDVFFSLGGKLFDKIQLSYVYELPISSIAPHTTGSHEVVLGLSFLRAGEIQNRKNHQLQKQMKALEEKTLEQYEQIDQLQRQIENLTEQLSDKQQGKEASKEELDQLRDELLQKLREEAELRREINDSGVENGADFEAQKEALREESAAPHDEELVKAQKTAQVKKRLGISGGNATAVKASLEQLRHVEMDEPDKYDYYVVLGAYKPSKYAMLYQAYLLDSEDLPSLIIRGDDERFYYITTNKVNDIEGSIRLLNQHLHEDFLINGDPWVYRKSKEANGN